MSLSSMPTRSPRERRGSPKYVPPTVLDKDEPKLNAVVDGLVHARMVQRRHPLRWIAAGVVLLLIAVVAQAVVTNPNFGWSLVGQYLFDKEILSGLGVTIELTLTVMVIAIGLGVVLALMRLSENPLLRSAAAAYVWAFRGVPTLVQIIFWFNLGALFPIVGFGIPFGPELISGSANNFVTPLVAANLGLGLCEAAYMAEIVRSGVLGVDAGQMEAASAVGLTRMQTMRVIVLPQAMRIIIPPTGNEVIGMLKYTSLASVISVTELLQSSQNIYQRNFETIPLLVVASIWYLVLTTLLTIGQRFVERRLGRGVGRAQPRRRWRRPFVRATSALH